MANSTNQRVCCRHSSRETSGASCSLRNSAKEFPWGLRTGLRNMPIGRTGAVTSSSSCTGTGEVPFSSVGPSEAHTETSALEQGSGKDLTRSPHQCSEFKGSERTSSALKGCSEEDIEGSTVLIGCWVAKPGDAGRSGASSGSLLGTVVVH